MARKQHTHEVQAYAAFSECGDVLYATIKPTRTEAEDALRQLNPAVEGYSYPWSVLPIYIGVDTGFQAELDV